MTNLNIVDVVNETLLEQHNILIEGDRIVQVASKIEQTQLKDTVVKDFSNHYAVPGLFDMHVHLATSPSSSDSIADVKQRLSFLLKGGVTGVRDMAGDVRQLAYLSRQALVDDIQSPDIFYSALMAGPSFFDDPRTHAASRGLEPGNVPWMRAVTMSDDTDFFVAQAIGSGASGIKLYADLPANVAVKIIKSAQQAGFPIWAHAAVIPAMPNELAQAGITSLSHAALMAWASAQRIPTSGKDRYTDFGIEVGHPKFLTLMQVMAENQTFLDATLLTYKKSNTKHVYSNGIKAAFEANKAGVPFVVGTDTAINYKSSAYPPTIDEMILMSEEAGLEPMKVLRAATINAARLLQKEDTLGSITPQKRANIAIFAENPLVNLNHLKTVSVVLKNGILIE